VHVISTDTLVENPIVAKWVERSLERMATAAQAVGLNITAKRLVPKLEDRFWVNLIGRGYPAPRPKFRWCTSRLKINASTNYLLEVASERGEAILCLGTRRTESQVRARVMSQYEGSTRQLLHRNGDSKLDRVWIFPPIAEWTNDDVWTYLIENDNPWGHSNRELFHLYKGATPDAECPLVVDSSTPSCGDSRFGCYVCTMVDKDKSMQAMIQNDEDKRWMIPLATFREKHLSPKADGVSDSARIDDDHVRDFRKMDGRLQLFERKNGETVLVHGPYLQEHRERLLVELLKAQEQIRKDAPAGLQDFELIGIDELEKIREIWVNEKHEIEDSLPDLYEQATGVPYPNGRGDDNQIFSRSDIELLKEVAEGLPGAGTQLFPLIRQMLHVEQGYRSATRRVGIYDELERALKKHAFDNETEALQYATQRASQLDKLKIRDSVADDFVVSAVEANPQDEELGA
jgi:DNA sulfur modification protein DndC